MARVLYFLGSGSRAVSFGTEFHELGAVRHERSRKDLEPLNTVAKTLLLPFFSHAPVKISKLLRGLFLGCRLVMRWLARNVQDAGQNLI